MTNCTGGIKRKEIFKYLDEVQDNLKNKIGGFANNEVLICSAGKQLKHEDIEKIRVARKRSLSEVSDEALLEYFALSRILVAVRNKK